MIRCIREGDTSVHVEREAPDGVLTVPVYRVSNELYESSAVPLDDLFGLVGLVRLCKAPDNEGVWLYGYMPDAEVSQ